MSNRKSNKKGNAKKICEKNDSKSSDNADDPLKEEVCKEDVKVDDSSLSVGPTYRLLPAFVILLGIVVFFWPNHKTDANGQERKLCMSFVGLNKEFPKQNDDFEDAIGTGISNLVDNQTPTPLVFLLIFKKGAEHNTQKFVMKLSKESLPCFGSEAETIVIQANDWATSKNGAIIEKYKTSFKNGGILQILNINEIPFENIDDLHSICDTYSPIHPKVAVFLTLSVDRISEDDHKNLMEKAESELEKLWADKLDANAMSSLVTRVTDQVLILKT